MLLKNTVNSNYKSNKSNKSNKINYDVIFLINLLVILQIYLIKQCSYQFTSDRIYVLSGITFALSIISIVSMYLFYFMYKNDFVFIIGHIFLIITIEYNYLNYFFEYLRDNYISSFMILEMILFFIDYLSFSNKDRKISKLVLQNKMRYICISLLILVSDIVYEIYFAVENFGGIRIKGLVFIECFISFYLVVVTIKIYKKALEQKKTNFYFFIAIGVNILIFKKIYIAFGIISETYDSGISLILGILSGFIISIGFLYEIVNKVTESEELKFNLNIFYKFVENNPNNNFVLLSENKKVLYANALVRQKYCKDSDDIQNQYNGLLKYASFKSCFNNADILRELDKIGKFSGIICDNEDRHIKIEAQRIRISNSYVDLYSYIDVTETFNANEKLRQSEEKLNTIFESTLDIIVGVDVFGNIEYINKSGAQSVHFKTQDLLGTNTENLVVDYDKDRMSEFIMNSHINNVMIRNSLVDGDSNIVPFETIIKKSYDKNGKLMGYTIVARNITMRNKLDKITEKYKEIKEYDKIRTEFFANISHEVRTPINIIYSCIQLLNKKEKNSEDLLKYYDKYAKTIKQNCFRILRLINNIIDITKFDSEKGKIDFTNHDIVSLVEDITMSTVPFVESKKLNITFDTTVEELVIKCSPDNIERVILNLISNAVKFTNPGGNVSVEMDVDSKFVYIRVKDTGIGIPDELKNVIFERFVQTDKSLKRGKEGSGIGLALVKTIVKMHNGEVYVESTGKEGSVFLVKLPNVIIKGKVEMYPRIPYDGDNSDKANIEFSDIYDN